MLPTKVRDRRELGRKGLSFAIRLFPCCADKHLLAAYLRISEEDREKDKGGIPRQYDIALDRAHASGCCLGAIFVDDDLTASKEDVTRPAFELLLEELAEGVHRGVAVQHQDRFYRLNWDLERIRRIYVLVRKFRFITRDREYSMAVQEDITILRFNAIMGSTESSNTSRRVADAHQKNAQLGTRTGGPRAFGWNATPDAYHDLAKVLDQIRERSPEAYLALDKHNLRRDALTIAETSPDLGLIGLLDQYDAAKSRVNRERREVICPFESELLRAARRRMVKGTAPTTILREWNKAGIRGTMGGQWRYTPFMIMIMSPLMAGFRMYKDEISTDRHGNWVTGTQKKIFTLEEHLELKKAVPYDIRKARGRYVDHDDAEQDDMSTPINKKLGHGNRQRVLAGLLICFSCRTSMYYHSMEKSKTTTTKGVYRCENFDICAAPVTVSAVHTERFIVELVGRQAAGLPEVTEAAEQAKAKEWGRQGELDRLETARAYWSNEMDNPESDWNNAVREIKIRDEKIKPLLAARKKWVREMMASSRPVGLSVAEFQALAQSVVEDGAPEMDQLRTTLDRYLEHVLVKRTEKRTGRRFAVERLVPIWRRREIDRSLEPALA